MKTQLRLSLIFGVLFLLATAFTDAQEKGAKQDKKDSPVVPNYYPMQVGNQWSYKVTVGENTANAVSKIAKIETFDGLPMARLEASVNGNVVATEHLRATDKGIFRYRNNDLDIAPPICLLKFPIKDEAKWEGEIKAGADKGKYSCTTKEEKVEVPAGKYTAMRVSIRLEGKGGQNVTTTYWFVKDVGIVKQTVEASQLSILMELEKFEPGKEKDAK